MSTTPASSASPVHSEWSVLPPGVTYKVDILGGRPLGINDKVNGISIAQYLADLANYPIHNLLPNTTWPRKQWGYIYHLIVPHTEALDLYRQSVEKTLIEEGVPANKIGSAVAKIFTPFSILYKSFITTKNRESYYSDYFYESGRDNDHRLMEIDTTLEDCRVANWTGIGLIIVGVALNKFYKPKNPPLQKVVRWVGYGSIAAGLAALVFSTMKLHQLKN